MSLEDFLFGPDVAPHAESQSTTDTRTYCVEEISQRFLSMVNVRPIIFKLRDFNRKYQYLREKDRHSLYRFFSIPKKKGGLRQISAPNEELSAALRELKTILEVDCHALYHTAAFAYVKGRCTVDAVKRHQKNESKWFGKYDLSNFFGSTTPEFVMEMLSVIFPFCEIMKSENGKQELETALSLAFLDGGLPQGTPLSPSLTNIMMIPIDYKLYNTFRSYKKQVFVYTRYADDFHISSKYTFRYREIEALIQQTLAEFHAPFRINESKTMYGSSSGHNFLLGVILNKDNNITVGSVSKKHFLRMMERFVMDYKQGIHWELNDIQTLEGLRSYYRMVEESTIDEMVKYVNRKFSDAFYQIDIVKLIKQSLR